MIYQNNSFENTQNKFSDAVNELRIGSLLHQSNITKSCGIPAFEVKDIKRKLNHGSIYNLLITIFRLF